MGVDTIFRLAGSTGPVVSLIALLVAIGVGLGVLIFTVRQLARSIEAQSTAFGEQMSRLKVESDERDKRIEELIAKQDVRITFIETRYASKEDMYKALGGWRQEIAQVHQRIDRVFESRHSKKGET